MSFSVADLLALAKDYRVNHTIKNPFNEDEYVACTEFPAQLPHQKLLKEKLKKAHCTSFVLDENTVNNTGTDGMALLSESHTFPHSRGTWSNICRYELGYTDYFMSDVVIVTSQDWPDVLSGGDFFVINPRTVAIHYKTLPNGNYELEFLDPRWIIGYKGKP